MTALPNSVEPYQMKSEHPNATYEAFHKWLINEQARPKSMPYNKAACDSSSYNYASGRLDHQTYYAALDVDREDCNDLVMDPLFDVWFDAAVVNYGWLGGNPDAVTPAAKAHLWDWPKHRVADVDTEASANDKQLKNGSKSLNAIYTEAGEDYEDEILKQATANGISPEQQRQINMLLNLPQHVIPIVAQLLGIEVKPVAPPQTGGPPDGEDEE
jgi:capsid protein